MILEDRVVSALGRSPYSSLHLWHDQALLKNLCRKILPTFSGRKFQCFATFPWENPCQDSHLILLLQFKPAASWFSTVGNGEWAYPSCHTIVFHIVEGCWHIVSYSAIPFLQFSFLYMNYIWTNDFCSFPVDSKIYLRLPLSVAPKTGQRNPPGAFQCQVE